jgi:hypothetical protein
LDPRPRLLAWKSVLPPIATSPSPAVVRQGLHRYRHNTKKCTQRGCDFKQDFEDNTEGWLNYIDANFPNSIVRVGSSGIGSSSGNFHGEVSAKSYTYTKWGGYCKSLSPVCTGAVASPNKIWPPNHKFHTFHVSRVTDPYDNVAITVTSIYQDELVNSTHRAMATPALTLR